METQTQIPPEWRAAAMELQIPERKLPDDIPDEIIDFKEENSFSEILDNDPVLKLSQLLWTGQRKCLMLQNI